jgi:hypothetical protein
MFGRKHKRDEEEVGLAGLGTGGISPALGGTAAAGGTMASLGTTPSVSVSPNPSPSAPPSPPEPPSPVTPGAAAPTAPAAPEAPAAPAGPATPSPAAPVAVFGPGMVPPNAAAVLGQILSGHGPVGELIQQIKADPEGFRQRMLAQAQAAGVSTTIMSPNWIAPPAGGPAQPAHVDVIDELTKAADLHAKGALTDAEFDALKKKLLGE